MATESDLSCVRDSDSGQCQWWSYICRYLPYCINGQWLAVGHNKTFNNHFIGSLFSVLTIISALRMAGASRKPYKVLDRTRSVKKGVMASSLEEFITSAQRKLCYSPDTAVVAVLEEDGTEVDEDDYFQTLDPNTCLMLLHAWDRWSPFSAVALGMSYIRQYIIIPAYHLPKYLLLSNQTLSSSTHA